jgi:hypothetical protein
VADAYGILVRVRKHQIPFFHKDSETGEWVGHCPQCDRDGLRFRPDSTLFHDLCGWRARPDEKPIGADSPMAHDGRDHW